MNRALSCCLCAAVVACSGSDHSGNGDGDAASGGSGAGGATTSSSGGAAAGTGGATSSSGGATVGTGGATVATGGASGTVDTSASVLERNKHANRDGAFVQPTLTAAQAAKMAKDADFAATFAGNVWASPLYLEKGPGGKGVFIAVTTGNDVFALDETTGATVWTKNIGSSPTANGVSCGSIHPLGIVSTPVIDAATGTLYVAGAVGTTSIARHEIHALSVMDGSERPASR